MKKILLIEDNVDMRDNIAELLELSGYEMKTANNGKEGVQKAIEFIPDLIICDIMMPELDGYEVLHILSNNPLTETIPFLFLSAKSEGKDMRKGMNLGADDYLTKPFEELDLLNAVETRLKRSDQMKSSSGEAAIPENIHTIESLIEGSIKKEIRARSFIYSESDHFHYLYYIKSGKVRIFKSHDAGKEFTTNLFGPDDWFGLNGIFENKTYDHGAEALEDTVVHLIEKEPFLEMLFHRKDVAKKVMKEVLQDMEEKENKLVELAYNSVRRRVADALLGLYDKYSAGQEDYLIKLSREALASIAGTSTESAIRMLSEFKDSNLISTSKLGIKILEPEKLRKAHY